MSKFQKKYSWNIFSKIRSFIGYCDSGVWNDSSNTIRVRIIRTINLSVNSFLNRNLQARSMSLTYSTVLALVPTIALLVAIGRGFGLQNYLQDELYNFFPSQHTAISTALNFVDSYLSSTTQGVFVGAGILFLLWTVISLLSYIEDAFNTIWDIKSDRSFFQKITDYIAICLIIPVLMICSSGVSIFMSTTVQNNLYFPFLTPLVNICLELIPFFLCWAAFTMSYLLIPNTKVSIKYALISGIISAIAFQVLQLLFVNGQIYVSKYNAIYGSFSFLPLLLIWLQLSWMIVMSGCVLTYSLQNVFTFNFNDKFNKLSITDIQVFSLVIMGVIAKRFINRQPPVNKTQIALNFGMPIRTVNSIIENLHKCNLSYSVRLDNGELGEIPAIDLTNFSVANFYEIYDGRESDIIPEIKKRYPDLFNILTPSYKKSFDAFSTILIKDLPV